MSVSLQVDFLIYPLGSADFLEAFFSTICCRLENAHAGSRYPYLMNKLYYHGLAEADIAQARQELRAVEKNLRRLPPSAVVWDRHDLSKLPPWGEAISTDITSLANYFVTCDGRNLISVFFMAFDDAQALQKPLQIVNL